MKWFCIMRLEPDDLARRQGWFILWRTLWWWLSSKKCLALTLYLQLRAPPRIAWWRLNVNYVAWNTGSVFWTSEEVRSHWRVNQFGCYCGSCYCCWFAVLLWAHVAVSVTVLLCSSSAYCCWCYWYIVLGCCSCWWWYRIQQTLTGCISGSPAFNAEFLAPHRASCRCSIRRTLCIFAFYFLTQTFHCKSKLFECEFVVFILSTLMELHSVGAVPVAKRTELTVDDL